MSTSMGFTTRVLPDHSRAVFYGPAADGTESRFHYLVYWAPQQREVSLQHLNGASDEDREHAECAFKRVTPDALLATLGRRSYQHREAGTVWYVCLGRRLDDPLIQLELEQMIDEAIGVGA